MVRVGQLGDNRTTTQGGMMQSVGVIGLEQAEEGARRRLARLCRDSARLQRGTGDLVLLPPARQVRAGSEGDAIRIPGGRAEQL